MTPPLVPLHALFASARRADLPVGHTGQRLIAWREFASAVATLTDELRLRSEVRWLLTSDDPLVFGAQLLALLSAGKQAVIPHNAQEGTLAVMAGNFDARFAAHGDEIWSSIAARETISLPAIDPQHAVIDLYTSGSTGQPKRVRKTLAQFEAEVEVLEALWGEAIDSAAVLATVPHQHIYGLLFRLFWPLSSGRVIDSVTCSNPDLLGQRQSLFERAIWISSPAHLARLPQLMALDSLASPPVAIFSSGGPLSAEAASNLATGLGQWPIEIFGSTETGGVAWRQQVAGSELWQPFPCHQVACAADGALLLCSPFLAEAQPWVMDDGIELLPDGRFRLLGRLDRVVKIEAKRLSLPDMEARLAAHAWVAQAAVVVLAKQRQMIGAVVMLAPEGASLLQSMPRRQLVHTLRAHLARYFDAVLLPRHWRFVDELPVNARGKVDQAALQALFVESAAPVRYPRVLSVSGNEHRVCLELDVEARIEHFAGHFPGAALLPGVVQIDWAVFFARQYLALAGRFSALESVKFLAVILPGTLLTLTLDWHTDCRRLDFSYASASRKYSAGRIIFGGDS